MQPVSADGKTLTATTKSDARGTLVFSALMDQTDGVASYAALGAVSAKTATAIQSVTFSAATDDAKFVTVATGETGDDFAKQANLSLDLNVQTGASSDANDKLAAVSYVKEVSGNIESTIVKLSGDVKDYVDAISGSIVTYVNTVSGNVKDYVDTVSGALATAIYELSGETLNAITFETITGQTVDIAAPSSGALAKIDGQTIKLDNTNLVIDCGSWDED